MGPLPPPARFMMPPDPPGHMPYAGTYLGAGYTPMPFNYSQDPTVYREDSLSGALLNWLFIQLIFIDISGSSGSDRLCKDLPQSSVALDLLKSSGSTASENDLNAGHAPLPCKSF